MRKRGSWGEGKLPRTVRAVAGLWQNDAPLRYRQVLSIRVRGLRVFALDLNLISVIITLYCSTSIVNKKYQPRFESMRSWQRTEHLKTMFTRGRSVALSVPLGLPPNNVEIKRLLFSMDDIDVDVGDIVIAMAVEMGDIL